MPRTSFGKSEFPPLPVASEFGSKLNQQLSSTAELVKNNTGTKSADDIAAIKLPKHTFVSDHVIENAANVAATKASGRAIGEAATKIAVNTSENSRYLDHPELKCEFKNHQFNIEQITQIVTDYYKSEKLAIPETLPSIHNFLLSQYQSLKQSASSAKNDLFYQIAYGITLSWQIPEFFNVGLIEEIKSIKSKIETY